MKRTFLRYVLPALLMLVVGTALGMKLDTYLSEPDTLDQLKKLESAFVLVNRRYVEDVNPGKAAEDAIEGMLDGLDPHSTYISAEDIKKVKQSYKGSFGGIGIYFEVLRDTARVISPIADGPSEQAGIMAGDRIVQISDSTAVGLSSEGIQDRLKGPMGTTVKMTVKRPGIRKRYHFTIERDEIPLRSVDSAFMVDDETGYVEISRFAMTTYDEFVDAVTKLKGQGMQRLVLDLRSNPGGVLKSAVRIADEMLSEGRVIVKTKGRREGSDQEFDATAGGSLEQQPVIVLVNPYSASASEIVAGALQDHDRALIVGQRTFGKGLVQKQFPLPDESVLQMTIARYYTPAGRLIQTPYKDGDMENYYAKKFGSSLENATYDVSEYAESIPDSLVYQTDHGRQVFGGGGILPDMVVPPDTNSVVHYVQQSGLHSLFVNQWFAEHEKALRGQWADRSDAFAQDYTVDAQTVDAFWQYAKDEGLTLTDDPADVKPRKGIFLYAEAQSEEATIRTYLKTLIASKLYGSRAARPIFLGADPVFGSALEHWKQARDLAGFHASTASGTADSVSDGE